MRAVIYARFSTEFQSSIEDQFRVCTEYAASSGLMVISRHEDRGISGAAIGNRPGLKRMLEAALAGNFDVVLVADLSRLSRSQADLPKIIDRLLARGLRIVGVQDGYDSERKGHKLQAGLSGIMGEAFREMVSEKTWVALETRARVGRSTGGRCYGYRDGLVFASEAAIVQEIFEKFSQGASCRSIAAELNARSIPSPGSTWRRKVRRCAGWVGSAIRAMLRNDRYTGAVRWNVSEWIKDPDSGKRRRRALPPSEWICRHDEALRIVSDDLFHRAQRRTRLGNDERLRSGGKPRYLLSGLLKCGECGANYTIAGPKSYACSSFTNGKACKNNLRVRKDLVERTVLAPVYEELLAPERVGRIALAMQRDFTAKARENVSRADNTPSGLRELDARISRLRERMSIGDPDLTGDELQAAIDRAEAKRKDLRNAPALAERLGKVLAALPDAAGLYRRQIASGLDSDSQAASKARGLLRDIFGGQVILERQGTELWARMEIRPAVLLQRAEGTDGSGGRI